jgi:hypothetical protein
MVHAAWDEAPEEARVMLDGIEDHVKAEAPLSNDKLTSRGASTKQTPLLAGRQREAEVGEQHER